jgi:hypothetical protein
VGITARDEDTLEITSVNIGNANDVSHRGEGAYSGWYQLLIPPERTPSTSGSDMQDAPAVLVVTHQQITIVSQLRNCAATPL